MSFFWGAFNIFFWVSAVWYFAKEYFSSYCTAWFSLNLKVCHSPNLGNFWPTLFFLHYFFSPGTLLITCDRFFNIVPQVLDSVHFFSLFFPLFIILNTFIVAALKSSSLELSNRQVSCSDSDSWAAVQVSVQFFYPGALKWRSNLHWSEDLGRVNAQCLEHPLRPLSLWDCCFFQWLISLQLDLLVLQARKTGFFHCSFSYPARTTWLWPALG